MKDPQHIVVVGMAYGDEGKGSMVDYLCRLHDGKLVVRYNGGPQAGHNVVTHNGAHHCFSQFGSGTLVGVETFLSKFMMIEPFALMNESNAMYRVRFCEFGSSHYLNPAFKLLHISEEAIVITPFHWLMNRIRETARGTNRHGSCGMGVGEARQDQLRGYPPVLAGELRHITWPRLEEIKDRMIGEVQSLGPFVCDRVRPLLKKLEDEDSRPLAEYYRSFSRQVSLENDAWLKTRLDSGIVIFEGAQGVLLDESLDLIYSTWSDCTLRNALELLGDRPAEKIGVLRTYVTRHGPGPFDSECKDWDSAPGEHNVKNDWQGPFRLGMFDMDAALKAIELAPIDGIALTHCDQVTNPWRFWFNSAEHSVDRESMVSTIEKILSVPVRYKSYGPKWTDKISSIVPSATATWCRASTRRPRIGARYGRQTST